MFPLLSDGNSAQGIIHYINLEWDYGKCFYAESFCRHPSSVRPAFHGFVLLASKVQV